MKHYRLGVLIVVTLVIGCAPREDPAFSESEVRSSIRAVLDGIGEAAQNKNVDEFMDFWEESGSLIYTRAGKTFVGWNEIYADHAKALPNLGNLTRNESEAFVRVLGPNAGVATTFTFLSSLQEDGSAQSAWFTFTATIARQQDQSWKVVQAHSSYPPSGMSPRGTPEE